MLIPQRECKLLGLGVGWTSSVLIMFCLELISHGVILARLSKISKHWELSTVTKVQYLVEMLKECWAYNMVIFWMMV